MFSILAKAALTAIFIVAMSELAKRSTYLAALLVALPLATAMTAAWLYIDTSNTALATRYAWSVLLLTPPGMVFLALIPLGTRMGLNFWLTLLLSALITGLVYYGYTILLQRVFNVTL